MEEKSEQKYDFQEIANILFGKIYKYNSDLLEKSEDVTHCYSYVEVFDFFITSHAMSFLKSVYFGVNPSNGVLLNCRSILEGLAIKKMFKLGKISKEQLELLRYQPGLIEKRNYWKFKDSTSKAFFPKDIESNYLFCKNHFTEVLKDKFTENEIEEILSSKVPFLCDPKTSYSKLIKEHLGENCLKAYSLLSVAVHPGPNLNLSHGILAQNIVIVLKLLEEEYDSLESYGYSLVKHINRTTQSYEAQNFFTAVRKISQSLDKIKTDFDKNFSNNYVSNTMNLLSLLFEDIALDRLLGLVEQVKCKVKPMIEILASFYLTYLNENDPPNRYALFLEHASICVDVTLGKETNCDKAFEIYRKLYPKGIEREAFEKAFRTPTGYTIDQKGKCSSITSMVRNVALLAKEENVALSYEETIMVDYVESQMLSHANGYMWFANRGAFSDTNNIFLEMMFVLIRIFTALRIFFNDEYKETKDYRNRKTSNVFGDSAKELNKLMKTIYDLQNKPMTDLHN